MMMIKVSGMLRTTLTTPPAKPRISGTGLTRMATKMTPSRNAPIADQKVNCTVIQNAPRKSYLGSDRKLKFTRFLLRTSHWCRLTTRSDAGPSPDGARSARVRSRAAPVDSRGPHRRSAARRRRGRDFVARRSDGVLEGLLPAAVGDHRRDRLVDGGGARGVALLQADAVVLIREPLADHLQLARVLGGKAGQDDVIGGDGVDRPRAQRLDAFGVGAVFLQRYLGGVLVLHLLCRGRAGHRAEDLAGHGVRTGDVGVVCLDQQVLVGDEVGTGEVHLLLALVGDRVGGHDVVDLAAVDQTLALGG